MAKTKDIKVDLDLNQKSEKFINKIESEMFFKSEFSGDSMTFDWVDAIDSSCPYIDNIFRMPKLTLIREEEVVKVERAKKITVASVKDLTLHTQNIEEVDEVTDDVKPSKILIERPEETFNIYENRFAYTLLYNLNRFLRKKEELLDNLELKNERVLEYAASTEVEGEKIKVELKITSSERPKEVIDKKLEKEINVARQRIAKIKKFIRSWQRCEMFKELEKANVPLVAPPIRRTNIILKNANFQVATKLWDYLQANDRDEEDDRDNLETKGDNILLGILDDAFLMDYFVLDSVAASKREQKKRVSEYAVVMIHQQIKRSISLLLNNGVKITEQELLDMVVNELKNERNRRTVDSIEVKNKFRSELDEYLSKTQNYF